MLPLFYRKWVPRDTMCPTAQPMVFSYVMLYGRDLIRVLRFPLLEASGWISLARDLLTSTVCEVRRHGVLRSSRGSTVGGLHLFVHFQSRKGASAADRVNGAYSAHRVYTWSILCVERHRIGFPHEEMSRLWCEC